MKSALSNNNTKKHAPKRQKQHHLTLTHIDKFSLSFLCVFFSFSLSQTAHPTIWRTFRAIRACLPSCWAMGGRWRSWKSWPAGTCCGCSRRWKRCARISACPAFGRTRKFPRWCDRRSTRTAPPTVNGMSHPRRPTELPVNERVTGDIYAVVPILVDWLGKCFQMRGKSY